MGEMKKKLLDIEEMIEDIYLLGDFYSPSTFRQEVYKEMLNKDIPTSFKPYVDKYINELLEE